MSYWKSKVLPKLKKLFDKAKKKKGASEMCKSFDHTKESLTKEIEEKTPDLQPNVVEIYRSSTIVAKKLFKEPNVTAVKNNPEVVQGVLQELANAECPGAQMLSDAGIKFGPALIPGPIVFLLEKMSAFLVEETLPEPKEETREAALETDTIEAAKQEEELPTVDTALEKGSEVQKESEAAAVPVPEEAPIQTSIATGASMPEETDP